MIKIFHTADVHVGLRFTRGYSESLQSALVKERVTVVARMADIANRERCNLFVVAGDLFDNLRVSKKNVRETAEALSRFEGVVVVLPGNHDYVQEVDDPLWPVFTEHLGERHLVLTKQRPYDLEPFGLDAILYPGVCTSKHSKQNVVGWIDDAVDAAPSGKVRIGVAHGSLGGLSPDFDGDYFPMTTSELEAINVHLWLLGHTHVRFPDRDSGRESRIFYPSTPEPDGFDCRHPGYAWIIEVGDAGDCSFRSVKTGSYQFHNIVESRIESEADLEKLRREFESYRAGQHLVKLKLRGRLNSELFDQIPEFRRQIETCVQHLEFNTDDLLRAIRQADIDGEFTENSFPYRFLSELARSEDDPLALQLAYEFVKEACR